MPFFKNVGASLEGFLSHQLFSTLFGKIPLAAVIFSFTLVVLAMAFVLCLYQLRVEGRRLLRLKATSSPPTLTLASAKRWHLFLSHNWANQDVVATIKRQLQLLLPGVKAFLE